MFFNGGPYRHQKNGEINNNYNRQNPQTDKKNFYMQTSEKLRKPLIEVETNNVKTIARIDEGSDVSVIDDSIIKMILQSEKLEITSGNDTLRMAVGDKKYLPQGKVKLRIKIKNDYFFHNFVIFKNLSHQMLLGLDFCQMQKIDSQILNNRIMWKNREGIEQLPYMVMENRDKEIINSIFKEGEVVVNNITQEKAWRDFKQIIPVNIEYGTPTGKIIEFEPAAILPFKENLHKVLTKPTILNLNESKLLKSFLENRERNFRDEPGRCGLVKHRIKTGNSKPVARGPYQESIKKAATIKQHIEEMLKLNIIRESESPWSAPVILVNKPDGSSRFCVDYRQLNQISESDAFPMPSMSGIVNRFQGAKYLTSLDLTSGYFQLEMHHEDIPKTAFVCSRGLYEFLVMPFGLKTAPSTFNRMVAKVLEPVIDKCALAYLDDIVIYSTTFQQHLKDIDQVFNLLFKNNLYIKLKKCQFCVTEFKFLGNIIKEGQIFIDGEKMESIATFKRPTSVKEVQRFLGLANWLRKHVQNFAKLSRPLTLLTAGKNPKKDFVWSDKCEQSFNDLKIALMTPGIGLRLPDFNKTFIVEADASDIAVGGVLLQKDELDSPCVVEYASRTLKKYERNYTISEKECLAIVFCLKKFRPFLHEAKFTVITDHKALKWLFKTKEERSQRLARWALCLQDLDYTIEYRKGSQNTMADALSRGTTVEPLDTDSEDETMGVPKQIGALSINFKMSNLSIEQIKKEQMNEKWIIDIIQRIKNLSNTNPEINNYKNYFIFNNTLFYTNKGTNTNNYRLIIPRTLIYQVLDEFHNKASSGHYGIEKTSQRIKDRLFWHRMDDDISLYVKSCFQCQLTKHPNKTLRPPMKPNYINEPMEVISIDLIGPMPRSKAQNLFILSIIDGYSKFPILFPLKNSGIKNITKCLELVFTTYGVPQRCLSDNGPQFLSAIYKEMCELWNVKPEKITPYRAQANFVETANKLIKRLIRCYTDKDQLYWDLNLNKFQLAMRTAVNETTGFTPAKLFLGRELKLPWDSSNPLPPLLSPVASIEEQVEKSEIDQNITKQIVKTNVLKNKLKQKTQYDKTSRPRTFKIGDVVKIKNFALSDASKHFSSKLDTVWKGPFIVTKVINELVYEISQKNGKPKGKWNIAFMDYFIEREENQKSITDKQPEIRLKNPLTAVTSDHPYDTRSKTKK